MINGMRNTLGGGLEILLKQNSISGSDSFDSRYEEILIDKIVNNPKQPRKYFSEESIEELSESIKNYGIIQPIIVQKDKDQLYFIVAGERRWRAAQKAGLIRIPAIVKTNEKDKNLEISLIENIQRENLNAIEEAEIYSYFVDTYRLTHQELAKKIGKSRSYITNSLRLLKLPQKMKDMLIKGDISNAHAKILLSSDDADKMMNLIKQNKSIREIEKINQDFKKSNIKNSSSKDPDLIKLENKIKHILRLNTCIKLKNVGGSVIIDFKDMDDFDKLIAVLSRPLSLDF